MALKFARTVPPASEKVYFASAPGISLPLRGVCARSAALVGKKSIGGRKGGHCGEQDSLSLPETAYDTVAVGVRKGAAVEMAAVVWIMFTKSGLREAPPTRKPLMSGLA